MAGRLKPRLFFRLPNEGGLGGGLGFSAGLGLAPGFLTGGLGGGERSLFPGACRGLGGGETDDRTSRGSEDALDFSSGLVPGFTGGLGGASDTE